MQKLKKKINLNNSKFNSRSFVFLNQVITKKDLEDILAWMFRNYGIRKTCMLAELLKEAGFNYATQGGLSINLEDLKVPRSKTPLVNLTNTELEKGETQYKRGELTSSEWFQKQVMAWNLTSEVLKNEIVKFFERTDPLNPLYMMTFSGARGNLSQVRQLIGMRGLMSDQKGEMIGSAIQKNFREGLTVIDFLISSYGARKGLVDTAIRTADSGYMTRRLIDIAQDVVVRQFDCQSKYGVLILKTNPFSEGKIKSSFEEKLLGRTLAKPIIDKNTKKLLAHRGQEIDFDLLKLIKEKEIQILSVRSPLTCQSYRSVCQMCFGWDLTQHRLIEIGEAIGIIAAQSIGEPGTQLTMRTFHTGGVFSRELNQQIRSQFSGQVKFAENLKTNFVRTNQGDYGQVIINTSFFDIITYKNEVLRIKIERDDLLMIKDGEFIKKGQPIVQSASQLEESDTEIQKTLTTKFSGEIYYQPRQKYNFFEYNMIVWVLAGTLVILPFEAKKYIRSLKHTKYVFAKTKLVVKSNPFTEIIRVLNLNKIGLISQFSKLKKLRIQVYKNQQIKKPSLYILKLKDSQKLVLRKDITPENLSTYIGRYITDAYQIKTGGILYNLNPTKLLTNPYKAKTSGWLELNKATSFIWLPEETFYAFPKNYIFQLKDTSFVQKGDWIFSNKFAPVNGLLQPKKQGRKLTDLTIKSGIILVFNRELVLTTKFYHKLNGRFFFPGDSLFGRISIDKLVYSEVIISANCVQLLLRPIVYFNILHLKNYKPIGQNLSIINGELVVRSKRFLTFKLGESINATIKKRKNIVETGLFVNFSNQISKQQPNIVGYFKKENSNHWSLEFGHSQNFNQPNISPRRFKTHQSQIKSTVKIGQILEPYTVIGFFEFTGELESKAIHIRSKYSKRYQSQELIIVSNQHVRSLYFDDTQPFLINNEFLFAGDLLANSLVLTVGGKIFNKRGSKIDFRIGKPYLFTEGAKVYKNHEDFAPENTVLGFVTYKIFKTQDIIQGLPKVEEILEARSSSDKALISDKAGVITKIINHQRSRSIQVEMLANLNRSIQEVEYVIEGMDKEDLEIEPYMYINITDRFYKGLIDPQQVLDIYFDYFRQRDSHQKATLRSLYKLASMFIKSIQGVYESQGIRIVDRHLEVIVRQMIVKAKIKYAGSTPLVSGEYLDVQQVVSLNKMLQKKNKSLVFYKPAILGLTKAALTTESFISAASFQETIRILTQAAIEGKVDWLRGLKERVIVGGLIPCGTGVLTFLDEWIAKHIFLYGRSIVSSKTRRKLLRKKIEKHYSNSQPTPLKENIHFSDKVDTLKGKSNSKSRIKTLKNRR
uniref:RNA polymerase b''-subunit n=1 Tax=Neustupella aerophytica TaxID=2962111 RepID=UPI0021820953|nr:RNA polymerase b''-subunit [Neustupella aerophytica]UVI61140.1 RNA polymerase b''-subunit [Neustupella aerophytica]